MRIGVLGGGQLGRMLALAGLPLGHTFTFLDPGDAAPMAPVARQIRARYDDKAALDQLAAACDVVTWEFENVTAGPLLHLEADGVPVRPGPRSLEPKQDRLDEKLFFRRLGIPTTDFEPVDSRSEFDGALKRLGTPIVVKTRRQGYDGKGQAVIDRPDQIEDAWAGLGGQPLLLERKIPFDRELSILAVRSLSGECRFWPLVENRHESGMLVRSVAPMADDTPQLEAQADDYVRRILDSIGHVGVLALELFQVGDDLLANEMAPRVHNSGHWTIEGAVTSQFANHVRAITDRPLGSCEAVGLSVMINLIGTVPDEHALLTVPGASLHLYGKSEAPRRKLGHVTVVSRTIEERMKSLAVLDSLQSKA
ncbi:MAG: 5-(carboxyamino)imidazole ribonucleotide synthase [Candidatus Eisenbacteria bacterium]|nr:5-(carboxyamino)imidazole ribonucleotide synthase [Candidatus Eisenbacteria bacterium]